MYIEASPVSNLMPSPSSSPGSNQTMNSALMSVHTFIMQAYVLSSNK